MPENRQKVLAKKPAIFPVLIIIGLMGAWAAGCNLTVQQPDQVFDSRAQNKIDSQLIEAYLTKYRIEGVQATNSGLRYKVLKEGKGPAPELNDIVSVNFTLSLLDSTVLETRVESVARRYNIHDSTTTYVPYKFNFGHGFVFGTTTVQGLREGSQLMKLGDRYAFYIPSKLGFGQQGYGKIAANAVLVWDMEIVQIR